MFLDANIVNPDGSSGVDVFVTVDEDWGFHENEIPFDGTEAVPGFDQKKEQFYGTLIERNRADADAFLTGDRQYTRYVGGIHQLTDDLLASGSAEVGGNDLTIHGGVLAGNVGSVVQLERTAAHELGHTVGLLHGGGDSVGCKNNYLSVMNYRFQFTDVADIPLDFSRQRLADLDENNLDENVGIELSFAADGVTVINSVIGGESGGSALAPIVVPTGQAVNYNRDAESTDTGVAENISFFDIATCQDAPTVLEGFNDWANLQIPFRDEITFADGVHTLPASLEEPDQDDREEAAQEVLFEEITKLVESLNALEAADFTGTIQDRDDIVAALEGVPATTVKSLVEAKSFEDALVTMIILRADIVDLGILDSDTEEFILESQADFIIFILKVVSEPFAGSDHLTPTANSRTGVDAVFVPAVGSVDFELTAGDPNPEDVLDFSLGVTGPSNGTVEVLEIRDRSVLARYTAGAGFVDFDEFTFGVQDDTGRFSEFETVEVILNKPPVADDRIIVIREGEPVDITLTGTDPDDDDLTFELVSKAGVGTIVFNPPGSPDLTYTPPEDYIGGTDFIFVANDGLQNSLDATITIIIESH